MGGYYSGQEEFRVEELTGRKRVVTLSGGSLPMGTVSFDGDQRVVTTWYPGNPRASQQVLGPTELPTEVKGIWRVEHLVRSPVMVEQDGSWEYMQDPERVRNVFDSIRRSGQELRVSWAGILRTGRLKLAKFPHERLEDIGWELTFEWNGRGGDRQVALESPSDRDGSLLERAFQAFGDAVRAANRVADRVEGSDPSQSGFSARTLIDGARRVQSAVTRASALADRAVGVAKLPLDVVNSFSSVATNIRAEVRAVADSLADTPTELLSSVETSERALSAYAAFHTARYQAEKLSEEATRQESAKLRRVDAPYQDVVLGREGQSLRDLARRYYDDPDGWEAIADANGLEGSVLAEGMVLVIPRRVS